MYGAFGIFWDGLLVGCPERGSPQVAGNWIVDVGVHFAAALRLTLGNVELAAWWGQGQPELICLL